MKAYIADPDNHTNEYAERVRLATAPSAPAPPEQGETPGVAAVAAGSPRKRTLEIGALCDPISEQLKGLISEHDGKMLDADNEAITRCYLMGYMADALTARARKRLLSKCQEAVRRYAEANISDVGPAGVGATQQEK